MANLRKNIARKRKLQRREAKFAGNPASKHDALKNRTVRSWDKGKEGKKSLSETIAEVKALRSTLTDEQRKTPTSVYHRYGKNSVRRIKVN